MLIKICQLCKRIFSFKLSVQLVVFFLAMFTLVVAASFVFLYTGVVDILETRSQASDIQRFQQFEYNINRFCSEIDLVSRRLIINSGLQELIGYEKLPQSEKAYSLTTVVSNFSEIMSNYDYVKSILYYGSDGLVVKCSGYGNFITFDKSKKDWFYGSEQYSQSKRFRQKLIWCGGYTDDDFGVLLKSGGAAQEPKYYITGTRNVLLGENTGTLVINIDMEYFTSIYNSNHVTPSNAMYVLDGQGRVISGLMKDVLGRMSATHQEMSADKDIQIFNFMGSAGQMQAVYYRLKTFGGILVSEIPMSEITKDVSKLRSILVLMFAVSFCVVSVFSLLWVGRLLRPMNRLTRVINKVGGGDLGLTLDRLPNNEIGSLISHFNRMSTNLKVLFERIERAEKEKRGLEMETLRAQINPHFIYNTLNTIKWMAMINKQVNIADSIAILADFLEPIFRNRDTMCTVREELRYVGNYVKLINYRFAGGFTLKEDIPDELLGCSMIRFLLQPVVENALVHGLMNRRTGTVVISMWRDGCDACVMVADNGDGMSDERLLEINDGMNERNRADDGGIGLRNVNRRLKLQFGDEYGVFVRKCPAGGTEVLLRMVLLQES